MYFSLWNFAEGEWGGLSVRVRKFANGFMTGYSGLRATLIFSLVDQVKS
jgi:hypothetical protein